MKIIVAILLSSFLLSAYSQEEANLTQCTPTLESGNQTAFEFLNSVRENASILIPNLQDYGDKFPDFYDAAQGAISYIQNLEKLSDLKWNGALMKLSADLLDTMASDNNLESPQKQSEVNESVLSCVEDCKNSNESELDCMKNCISSTDLMAVYDCVKVCNDTSCIKECFNATSNVSSNVHGGVFNTSLRDFYNMTKNLSISNDTVVLYHDLGEYTIEDAITYWIVQDFFFDNATAILDPDLNYGAVAMRLNETLDSNNWALAMSAIDIAGFYPPCSASAGKNASVANSTQANSSSPLSNSTQLNASKTNQTNNITIIIIPVVSGEEKHKKKHHGDEIIEEITEEEEDEDKKEKHKHHGEDEDEDKKDHHKHHKDDEKYWGFLGNLTGLNSTNSSKVAANLTGLNNTNLRGEVGSIAYSSYSVALLTLLAIFAVAVI